MSEAIGQLTAERLRSIIFYDPVTGKFSWLRSKRNMAGDIAGCISLGGYIVIRVDGKLYRSCRLAWLYMHGLWPTSQIDHINLDRADDRWVNLREATNSQNSANKAKSSRNTTGLKGVSRLGGRKYDAWCARVTKNGETHYLGTFTNPDAAHAAFVKASIEIHGKFARPYD